MHQAAAVRSDHQNYNGTAHARAAHAAADLAYSVRAKWKPQLFQQKKATAKIYSIHNIETVFFHIFTFTVNRRSSHYI